MMGEKKIVNVQVERVRNDDDLSDLALDVLTLGLSSMARGGTHKATVVTDDGTVTTAEGTSTSAVNNAVQKAMSK